MAKRALNDQKRGSLGINEVYQGDCLQLMKFLPDGAVDFILADPPYGIDYRSFSKSRRGDKGIIANDRGVSVYFEGGAIISQVNNFRIEVSNRRVGTAGIKPSESQSQTGCRVISGQVWR